MTSGTPFRHSAGFGRRIEFWIIGRMLKEGLDVYVPLVDDHGVDAIVRRKDGTSALIQIKARSKDVVHRNAALFASIEHQPRDDYWFVFYSERMDTTWLMTSAEFLDKCLSNKTGKHVGSRSIWLNGTRRGPTAGKSVEYCRPQFERYVVTNFSRIVGE